MTDPFDRYLGFGASCQDSDVPLAPMERQQSCAAHSAGSSREPFNTIDVSSSSARPASATQLWTRQHAATSPPSGFADSFNSRAPSLLLTRNIREDTLHRVEGGLPRIASNYAQSGDDTDDGGVGGRSLNSPSEVPEGWLSGGGIGSSGRAHSTTSFGSPRMSSPVPTSTTPVGEAAMNFESLWSNIDRYLFAVYTTLQTGDESSLRPLRTPKHRMGWYTVIYNACSGDPAKSRELYTRLALLLLHLLESHVLFPILQNVDHSRVQFITGAEDRESSAAVEGRPLGFGGSGGSGGSGGIWGGRFRSIASLNGAAAGGSNGGAGSARAVSVKEESRNSSFQDNSAGANATTATATPPAISNNASNSSFGFMRRLFHSATSGHVSPSQQAAAQSELGDRHNNNGSAARRSPSPAVLSGRRNWQGSGLDASGRSPASPPSTPTQTFTTTSVTAGAGRGKASLSTSQAASRLAIPDTSHELRSAFEGFDSTVHRGSSSGATPKPLPAPAVVAYSDAEIDTVRIGTPPPPAVAPTPQTPHALATRKATTTRCGVSSSSVACSPLSEPRTASLTAVSDAISFQHARVASKTGRVLVDDEEEVLCEANTVSGPAGNGNTVSSPSNTSSRTSRRNPPKATPEKRSVGAAAQHMVPPSTVSLHDRTRTVEGVGADDDVSLHSMRSSLSTVDLSRDESESEKTAKSSEHRRPVRGRISRVSHRRNFPFDSDEEDRTAAPSDNFFSPSSPSLASMDASMSPTLSPEASARFLSAMSSSVKTGRRAHNRPNFTPATANVATAPAESSDNARSTSATPSTPQSPCISSSDRDGPLRAESGTALPATATASSKAATSPVESAIGSQGPSSGGGGATAVPDEASRQGRRGGPGTSVTSDGTSATTPNSSWHGNRQFSLCYTFFQEWQTFLIFRSVVLSCFRYLDQYYTRRFGMDTIVLMCSKVFYVAVYEPLHPLLMTELRFLMQYVREVFGATGEVAWEQLMLIQTTYNIMTELLVLVQSTSSSMVAQQQQQKQNTTATSTGGGMAGATVTDTTSTVVTVLPPSQASRSRASSRARSSGGGNVRAAGEGDSNASSGVSTPRLGPLEGQGGGAGATADSDRTNAPRPKRSRIFALFSSSKRHNEGTGSKASTATAVVQDGRSTASQPISPRNGGSTAAAAAAATAPAASARRSTGDPQACPTSRSPPRNVGPKHPDVEAECEAAGVKDGRGGGTGIAEMLAMNPTVLVDLRGTVELRDRLEGHTTAHHLTTQALKQWEGLSADRRLRNGTIVKEVTMPLVAFVMQDVGNDYVTGVYTFYRHARDAHRASENGCRTYVEWASKAKELEMLVWKRVRLPFLHTAIRSALNEVLVVEPHRKILLDPHVGLRALLDAWSARTISDDLTWTPNPALLGMAGGAATSAASAIALHVPPPVPPQPLAEAPAPAAAPANKVFSKATSEIVRSPIQLAASATSYHRLPSFPHCRLSLSTPSELPSRQTSSQLPVSSVRVEEEEHMTGEGYSSGSRWGTTAGASSASVVMVTSDANVAMTGGVGAIRRGVDTRQHVGSGSAKGSEWMPGAQGSTPDLTTATNTHAVSPPPALALYALGSGLNPQNLGRGANESNPLGQNNVPGVLRGGPVTTTAGNPPVALQALRSLYGLFSDVAEDECFVLMAAVLITKFIREAADIFEDYLPTMMGERAEETEGHHDGTAAGDSRREGPINCEVRTRPQTSLPSAAPFTAANAGVEMMASFVDVIDRYTELVETVFQGQPTLRRALGDAMEEVMCPTRWTKKGSLQAAQQRAHEMLVASAAAAAAAATATATGAAAPSPSEEIGTASAAAKSELPSVLLSRDARQATEPLAALANLYPHALPQQTLSAHQQLQQPSLGLHQQQLQLSVLLARYADTVLQQERVGGRVVSGGLYRRLRLVGNLVSLLEDKDTFLEHYRLCLARRLLGFSSAAAAPPASTPTAAAGGVCATSSGTVNLEAERQLVSCLQSHLGTSSTHAFETMLRDYEGTQRTRELFEQEPGYAKLAAKIRVQLITSAQWPTYTMLPLHPHVSLQTGVDVFRTYYAKQHPSRTLLWVYSLGTATLHADLVSGPKQIVASTLLATLLLVVSDAYNTTAGVAGSITGALVARKVGLPFQALRTHLHLLSQHRAFNLLRWMPSNPAKGVGSGAAAMAETDSFTLNPSYTHKLRKVRLPMPKARLTDLRISGGFSADAAVAEGSSSGTGGASSPAGSGAVAAESEDAAVTRHVNASRRLLMDTALVRVFKSRRVMLFEDLFQTVTAQLSRQFVPSRRDVKTQLEGLIDRDYVKRSPDDPNAFVYIS